MNITVSAAKNRFVISQKEGVQMNMIICTEPCIHQHDGCCGLHGAGVITNTSVSACRYFSPKEVDSYASEKRSSDPRSADKSN